MVTTKHLGWGATLLLAGGAMVLLPLAVATGADPGQGQAGQAQAQQPTQEPQRPYLKPGQQAPQGQEGQQAQQGQQAQPGQQAQQGQQGQAGQPSQQGQPGQPAQQTEQKQQQPVRRTDLIGTWQLVSYKYGTAPGFTQFPSDRVQLKHVTPSSFVWLRYGTTGGQIEQVAGGDYRLEGGNYTEQVVYGHGEDVKPLVGQSQNFTARIEGNRWHHTGVLSNGFKIEEIWERVKGQEGDWVAELRNQGQGQAGQEGAQQASDRQEGQGQDQSGQPAQQGQQQGQQGQQQPQGGQQSQ